MKCAIILILLSFAHGCKKVEEEKGKAVSVKFEVKNLASKELTILLFSSNDSLYKKVEVQSLDSLMVEEGVLRPAPSGPTYSLTNSLDSAILQFSDGKKLVQTTGARGNNDTINNILLDIYYTNHQSLNSNIVRKQFIINESDYLRSQ